MSKIDLGQTIAILANMGVIAGIVFLGLELRQNNELLDAQARTASTQVRLESQRLLIGDHNVAGLVSTLRQGEHLSNEDATVISFFYAHMITTMQYAYEEYASGRVPDRPIGSATWPLAFSGEFMYPGLREYWEARRGMYGSEFTQWMDAHVVNVEAKPETSWQGVLTGEN